MATHISSDASQMTIMKRSTRGRCRRAILASCMALALFAGPGMVWAGDSDKHRLINQQRVQDLKERVADVKHQLETHRHHHSLEARVAALEAKVASMASFDPTALQQAVTSLQNQVNDINNVKLPNYALNTKLMELSTKVDNNVVPDLKKYVSINTADMNGVTGPHIVIEGANLHVRSGSGASDDAGTLKGLGNLIIGYNEASTGVRTGSHNLVGGKGNAFPSYGGLVFGLNNMVSAPFSAVVSGDTNTASGVNAAVFGGNGNTAGGVRSVVYGGLNVTALNQNSYAPMQSSRPAGN